MRKCGRIFRIRQRRKRKVKELCLQPHQDKAVEDNMNFMTWMRRNGFKSQKKLKISYFEDTGRGVMTCEALRAGELIISLPYKFLITPATVKKSYLGSFINSMASRITGMEILTVFLMCEKSRGNLSPWQTYLNTLPKTYSTPAYFTSSVRKKLPFDMYSSCIDQLNTIKSSFIKLKQLFYSLETSFPDLHGAFLFDSFKWAWFTVNTRCVYIDCGKSDCLMKDCGVHLALAPYLDFLNHSCNVKVSAGYNQDSKCYEIISHNCFKKYEQVFINYGNHDNRKLLLEYGFLVSHNPNDFIPVSRDNIIEAIKKTEQLCEISLNEKMSFLEQRSFLGNLGFCRDGITWNLQTALQFLVSNDKRACVKHLLDLPLKPEEIKLYKTLTKNLLLEKLHFYMNNLDEIYLCSENEKLALLLCHEEEEIIKNILLFL